MSALKLHIGLDGMSCKEFRARIQDVGVDIKPYELSQVNTCSCSIAQNQHFLY